MVALDAYGLAINPDISATAPAIVVISLLVVLAYDLADNVNTVTRITKAPT